MKILLDECLPRRLGRLLPGHEVRTVREMGWLGLSNGRLLNAASEFDVLLTVDKNLVKQQHLEGRHLAVVVLRAASNKIEDLAPLIPRTLSLLGELKPGSFIVIG